MIDHRNGKQVIGTRGNTRELIEFEVKGHEFKVPLHSIQVNTYSGPGQDIYDHIQILLPSEGTASDLGQIAVARFFDPLLVVQFSGKFRQINDIPDDEIFVAAGDLNRIFGKTALVREMVQPDESVRESFIRANIAKTDGALEQMLSQS